MGGKNRRYFSEHYGSERLFLVFKKEQDFVSSEGPFTNVEKAQIAMNEFLSQGICSWMVSYNEE
jgi:hypothetical protein